MGILDKQALLTYLQASPTPFHAVGEMSQILKSNGFKQLSEADSWSLPAGGKYFVTRNDSSIIAFTLPVIGEELVQAGMRMMGAHTDSPCLKVKPDPDINKNGYYQLGVEVYGGALLNPWFDRDLSLAGRVTYTNKTGEVVSALIDLKKPVAVIPSLAIHLDREANSKRSVNPQKHLPPLLSISKKEGAYNFRSLLKETLLDKGTSVVDVLDFEVCCYDTQPPAIVGLNEEFIASARLDNLLSCYVGMNALLNNNGDLPCLLVCNDHEEVGSASVAGAQGTFLKSVLERLCPEPQALTRMITNSMMISIDNAHGIHPNFADKHDENHGPIINQGPVMKVNASQRYASNSETTALYRHLCNKASIPVQSFVVRSDMGCGSTIGPIAATEIGVRTLDIGVPTFAMHSVRELAGVRDTEYLFKSLVAFCESAVLPTTRVDGV